MTSSEHLIWELFATVSLLSALLWMSVLWIFCKHLRRHIESICREQEIPDFKVHSAFKLSIITCICCLVAQICQGLTSSVNGYAHNVLGNPTNIVNAPQFCLFMISLVLGFISWSSFCIFQVSRLYNSFKGTAYAVSKSTLTFFAIMCIMCGLCWITLTVGTILQFSGIVSFSKNTKLVYYGTVILVLCVLVVLPCSVSYLFALKLFQLSVSLRHTLSMQHARIINEMKDNYNIDDHDDGDYINNSYNNALGCHEIELNEQQESTLRIITKQTLLTFVQSCSIVVNLIYFVVVCFLYVEYFLKHLWLLLGVYLVVTTIFAAWPISLCLSFGFEDEWYHRICDKFDGCCLIMFQRLAIWKLEQRQSDHIDSYYQQMSRLYEDT